MNILKIVNGLLMNKQIQQQQNLKELSSERRILQLMRLTLINILNAKGVIYTYYKKNKKKGTKCLG